MFDILFQIKYNNKIFSHFLPKSVIVSAAFAKEMMTIQCEMITDPHNLSIIISKKNSTSLIPNNKTMAT